MGCDRTLSIMAIETVKLLVGVYADMKKKGKVQFQFSSIPYFNSRF